MFRPFSISIHIISNSFTISNGFLGHYGVPHRPSLPQGNFSAPADLSQQTGVPGVRFSGFLSNRLLLQTKGSHNLRSARQRIVPRKRLCRSGRLFLHGCNGAHTILRPKRYGCQMRFLHPPHCAQGPTPNRPKVRLLGGGIIGGGDILQRKPSEKLQFTL